MATRDTGGGQSQSGRARQDEEIEEAPAPGNPEVAERHEKLTEDVDDLLDDFARSFLTDRRAPPPAPRAS